MTPVKDQGGFTIIEVVLFLALSGLVFIIGFMGIGGRNRQVQFNDSMRTVTSFLQSELSNVFNGVNNGVLVSNSVGDEVLLGKYVVFCTNTNTNTQCTGSEGSRALVYDVVGGLLNNQEIADIVNGTGTCAVTFGSTDIDVRLLDCSLPRVVGGPEVVSIDWGARFLGANVDVGTYAAPGFGFLRSPNSSRLILYTHSQSGVPGDNATIGQVESANAMFHSDSNGFDTDGSATFCFRGRNGQYANIIVGLAGRNTSIDLAFDPQWTPESLRPGVPPQIANSCGSV